MVKETDILKLGAKVKARKLTKKEIASLKEVVKQQEDILKLKIVSRETLETVVNI